MDKVKITVEGPPGAVDHFLTWLCESGEQQYWNWMEIREEEEPSGDITITDFDYHSSGRFGSPVIGTLGRLDGCKCYYSETNPGFCGECGKDLR